MCSVRTERTPTRQPGLVTAVCAAGIIQHSPIMEACGLDSPKLQPALPEWRELAGVLLKRLGMGEEDQLDEASRCTRRNACLP